MEFSGNSSYSTGGAIYFSSGNLEMSDNGSVKFSGNSSHAIYGGSDSTIKLSSNGSVEFSGNTTSSPYGGAVYLFGNLEMSENDSVKFSGNSASYTGGALSGVKGSMIKLSSNGSVEFSGNTASSYDGGAIAVSGNLEMSENGSVKFRGNSASSDGGAIHGGSVGSPTIKLSSNGSVEFSSNTASQGGAIYTYGILRIQNNDSVLFEKNAEVNDGGYRLRSVYAVGDGIVAFSAASGKSIEFRDSIYIASGRTFNLNEDYTDAKGKTIAQKGDIIFTGKTTEDDLYQVKGNVAGTEAEILASRTSEVNTMTNLYGGRLRVEDGAVYKGRGITAEIGSESTVRVKDAELSHVGYTLEFNSGTTLEVAGNSIIRGEVNLKEGSMFILEEETTLSLHETARADATTLTVNGGALLEGNSTLNAGLTLVDGALLDMAALDAGAVTVNGALTLGSNLTMGENLLALLQAATDGSTFVLFTGLDALYMNGEGQSGMTLADEMWVELCFSNLESSSERSYYLLYNNTVSGEGVLSIAVSGTSASVPEPTTATLSLLALAALAARRRRK